MISWDQITAECDGYRVGFVAVFRKYEGEPTDEKDAQGRTVKVTRSSFAEHVGVPRTTFEKWVRATDDVAQPRWEQRGAARTGQMARQAVKSEKVSIEDKIGMLKDLVSDPRVRNAWIKSEAPKVSASDAKAASAIAKALTDPIARSASKLQVPMWLDQLRTIREVLSEYEFDEDEVTQLDKAVRKLADELEVQKFRIGMTV